MAVERHTKPVGKSCHHLRYRLSCDDYDQLRDENDGCCWICDAPEGSPAARVLFIDHDEVIGGMSAVRGLLCPGCNTGLGTGWRLNHARRRAYLDNPWWWRAGRIGPAIWNPSAGRRWVWAHGPSKQPSLWPWDQPTPIPRKRPTAYAPTSTVAA